MSVLTDRKEIYKFIRCRNDSYIKYVLVKNCGVRSTVYSIEASTCKLDKSAIGKGYLNTYFQTFPSCNDETEHIVFLNKVSTDIEDSLNIITYCFINSVFPENLKKAYNMLKGSGEEHFEKRKIF